ncbi:glycosyltransferase family 4 protein [bacterium]|nr:glycosyltransferase family 4 protein [bacterium]
MNSAWNVWNFRMSLVRELLRQGYRVTVFAPRDDCVDRLVANGCDFRPLAMRNTGLNPLELLSMGWRFRKMINDLRPSIVLGFTIKNNLVGALLSKLYGVPFIPNVTGFGTAFLSGRALRLAAVVLYRLAFAGLARVFFQNTDDAQQFCRMGVVRKNQVTLVPGSGIDLERFYPSPITTGEANTTFVMIARLLKDKGVIEFAEAAAMVQESGTDARFVLVGPLDAENRTAVSRDLVDGWVESGVLTYAGSCDDVRPYIKSADCVVLPSYREGAPRTLIEASAMARPVIATRVPGCTAVVSEGMTGLLCEVRDSVSLAEAMQQFLAMTSKERQDMGDSGRFKMEQEFDEALVVDAYMRSIEAAVAGTL